MFRLFKTLTIFLTSLLKQRSEKVKKKTSQWKYENKLIHCVSVMASWWLCRMKKACKFIQSVWWQWIRSQKKENFLILQKQHEKMTLFKYNLYKKKQSEVKICTFTWSSVGFASLYNAFSTLTIFDMNKRKSIQKSDWFAEKCQKSS